MSIEVRNAVKMYGNQAALDDVSFQVGSGQVVGFLGPNGAGKSTMMKIITCILPATSGSVHVCGLDVQQDTMGIRRKIGYLPEHNPLYTEMFVKEYLNFVAGMYRVKNRKQRVDEMIELVGLTKEYKKRIGALSKGYRQRVGLAQAVIHDPEVLILDEPTSGLDPNQLVEVRNIITQIGETKTVMLSTHIMQEVEAMCDRVIIINEGRLVADDRVENIRKHTGVGDVPRQVVTVEFDGEVARKDLQALEGVKNVKNVKDNLWVVASHGDDDLRKQLAAFAQGKGVLILGLKEEERSMEDVFKALTKKK